MHTPSIQKSDRLSYLWLLLAASLNLFVVGEWAMPIAAWLGPLFVLRFLRTNRSWRSVGLYWLLSIPFLHTALNGIVPIPGIGFTIFLIIIVTLALIPYLIDRWLTPRLPGLIGTLVFPLSSTVFEYVNAYGTYGTFGSTAYTQFGNLALMQIVSVTGLWGIIFLAMWFASVVNWAWENEWSWPRVKHGVLAYTLIAALVMLYGTIRLISAGAPAETVRVAGIPSNQDYIATLSQNYPDLMSKMFDNTLSEEEKSLLQGYFNTSNDSLLERSQAEAQAGAKIVFWAEANAIVMKENEADFIERGRALAQEQQIYLGMAVGVFDSTNEKPLENKIVLIDPSGELSSQYLKAYPVPGGEAEASVEGTDIIPTLDTPFGRIAAVICFDMDHHHHILQAGRANVDILFAPSNDWEAVADLHMQMSTFRAIENGVTLVRPTSQGISVATDSFGRIIAQSDFYTTNGGALVTHVPAAQHIPTIYAIIGDLFAWLCAVALVGLAGWGVVRGRKGKKGLEEEA